jgi:hypothetical protein
MAATLCKIRLYPNIMFYYKNSSKLFNVDECQACKKLKALLLLRR